ncbi:hypothetical protein ATCC51561_1207 [Campylobacter concisus ATCC 51561]|nr:hypothetical protein ATCC51561_1207 [Campylobacter concisus ATCC 51561]
MGCLKCGNFMAKLLQKVLLISIDKDFQSYELDEDSNVEV